MASIIRRKGTQRVRRSSRQFQSRALSRGNRTLRSLKVHGTSESLRKLSSTLCEGPCLRTCLFPVFSAFSGPSSGEQGDFLLNNDKDFLCVMMFPSSFLPSFLPSISLQRGTINSGYEHEFWRHSA